MPLALLPADAIWGEREQSRVLDVRWVDGVRDSGCAFGFRMFGVARQVFLVAVSLGTRGVCDHGLVRIGVGSDTDFALMPVMRSEKL